MNRNASKHIVKYATLFLAAATLAFNIYSRHQDKDPISHLSITCQTDISAYNSFTSIFGIQSKAYIEEEIGIEKRRIDLEGKRITVLRFQNVGDAIFEWEEPLEISLRGNGELIKVNRLYGFHRSDIESHIEIKPDYRSFILNTNFLHPREYIEITILHSGDEGSLTITSRSKQQKHLDIQYEDSRNQIDSIANRAKRKQIIFASLFLPFGILWFFIAANRNTIFPLRLKTISQYVIASLLFGLVYMSSGILMIDVVYFPNVYLNSINAFIFAGFSMVIYHRKIHRLL